MLEEYKAVNFIIISSRGLRCNFSREQSISLICGLHDLLEIDPKEILEVWNRGNMRVIIQSDFRKNCFKILKKILNYVGKFNRIISFLLYVER